MILSLIPWSSNIKRRVDDLGSSQPSATSPNLLYSPPPKRLCFCLSLFVCLLVVCFGLHKTKHKIKLCVRNIIRFVQMNPLSPTISSTANMWSSVWSVGGGTLTPSIDGGLFYPLRQSNRYPCNQICYARGAFQSQTLYEPNFYKWASFVHRIQYSCSIYCSAPNGCRSTNAPRWKSANAQIK